MESNSANVQNIHSASNATNGPFSDPVYKKLATMNGEVNRMSKEELKEKLVKLKLDTRGQKDVMKKRLKNYYKRKQLSNIPGSSRVQRYDYLLVIDFEATCEKEDHHFNHEIIEFPVVLIDVAKKEIVDEFHAYVRPTLNHRLSNFCTSLTGITQETVDAAECFPAVLKKMQAWMASHKLGKSSKFAVVTDGPSDMSRFMFLQCQISGLAFPRFARKWINIRKSFSTAYRVDRVNITTMLEALGLAFEGTLHSGIDDARNIARVALQLLSDDLSLRVNERVHSYKISIVQDAVNKAKHGQDPAFYESPEVVGIGAHDRDESTDEEEEEQQNETVEDENKENEQQSEMERDENKNMRKENGPVIGDEGKRQPIGAKNNVLDQLQVLSEDDARKSDVERSICGMSHEELEACERREPAGGVLNTDSVSAAVVCCGGESFEDSAVLSVATESVEVTTDLISHLSCQD